MNVSRLAAAALLIASAGATDPFLANRTFGLHFDGNLADTTGRSWSAAGSADTTPTGALFGTGCGRFPNNNTANTDYFASAATAADNIGSGDFAVCGWVKLNSLSKAYQMLFAWTGVNNYIAVLSDGSVQFYNGTTYTTATGLVGTGTWTFISVSRVSGTLYIHVSGTNRLSTAVAGNVGASTGNIQLGYNPSYSGLYAVDGTLDDWRGYKGAHEFTSANYSVPTAAFP